MKDIQCKGRKFYDVDIVMNMMDKKYISRTTNSSVLFVACKSRISNILGFLY